jgi:hypothetical protein
LPEQKMIIGWKEWCTFPALGLSAIKAKIDTGATTSALHAFDIEPYEAGGAPHVRFSINPIRGRKEFITSCTAPVVDKRIICNSGGHAEERYVIQTLLALGQHSWEIELTLTNRQHMQYRMLLGRRAMSSRCIVDPGSSFLLGKLSSRQAYGKYAPPTGV